MPDASCGLLVASCQMPVASYKKTIGNKDAIMEVENRLTQKLEERKRKGNYRSLTTSQGLIDFLSNDYLGLARSAVLHERIKYFYSKETDCLNGATGSRLLSGNSIYAEALEKWLAQLFQGESALLFNSGYVANLSVLSCIPQKGDTIIYDELAHASMREGVRLSLANSYAFKHNDLVDLQYKLKKASGEKFVVVESVYSMDGDQSLLEALTAVCEANNAHIILDEAHSTGLYGKRGEGLACSLGLHRKVFARIYTFGKGMGSHGACVVGSSALVNYLINFARPFIYTTAPPLYNLVSIRCAFAYLKENINLQHILQSKIALFKKGCYNVGIKLKDSISAIQALIIPGNENVKKVANQMRASGFDVRPILSPTVRQGEERIRICLHAYNSEEEIVALIKMIHQATGGFQKTIQ